MKENHLEEKEMGITGSLMKELPRRSFLKAAGLSTAGLALLVEACKKDYGTNPYQPNNGLSFGTGDIAILNFAYALEQLEAAFYTKVSSGWYSGISPEEKTYLSDVTLHEVAHREFFKIALGSKGLPALQVDFSTIDFTSRTSVLAAAQSFEDLGVQAYNGAGIYIQSVDYLTIAGKIVSVEARHASYFRNLNSPNSFAGPGILDMNGLEQSKKPRAVLAIAGKYIVTKLDASTLPNS